MTEVVVVDYDPAWPSSFEALRSKVWNVVADLASSIEHVGSTSVPGLAAKPIIDMDVVVPSERVSAAIGRLATLGYEQRGDLGVSRREAFDGRRIHCRTTCTFARKAVRRSRIISPYATTCAPTSRQLGPTVSSRSGVPMKC